MKTLIILILVLVAIFFAVKLTLPMILKHYITKKSGDVGGKLVNYVQKKYGKTLTEANVEDAVDDIFDKTIDSVKDKTTTLINDAKIGENLSSLKDKVSEQAEKTFNSVKDKVGDMLESLDDDDKEETENKDITPDDNEKQ